MCTMIPEKIDTPEEILAFEKNFINNQIIRNFLKTTPEWKEIPDIPFVNITKNDEQHIEKEITQNTNTNQVICNVIENSQNNANNNQNKMTIWDLFRKNKMKYLRESKLLDLFIKPIILRIIDENGDFVTPMCCNLATNRTIPCKFDTNTKFVIHNTIGVDINEFFIVYKEQYKCLDHNGAHKKSKSKSHHYVWLTVCFL